MNLTEHDLQNIQARLAKNRDPKAFAKAQQVKAEKWAAGEEKALQEAIQTDAERRGYYVHRTRMDKRPTGPKGFPDLLIFGPKGVAIIECKAGNNPLSEDQERCIAALNAAGHHVAVCRNLKEAIDYMLFKCQP